MKILYGTTNPAKIEHLQEVLAGLAIEMIGLNDLDVDLDSVDESGNHPLENAKIKALAYYRATKMPVFSTDSGLYIEGLADEDQPGVHVRRVKGKELTDEEMIEHYTRLSFSVGGEAIAKYRTAICLVLDEENIFTYDGDDLASSKFLISSQAHHNRDVGFPLNSLSKDLATGKYYMDLKEDELPKDESVVTKGLRNFFLRTLPLQD